MSSSPGAETPSKGAVQSLASSLIGDFLFPDWYVGAIVSSTGVKRGKRRAIKSVRRLQGLKIGLKGPARPFAGHFAAYVGLSEFSEAEAIDWGSNLVPLFHGTFR